MYTLPCYFLLGTNLRGSVFCCSVGKGKTIDIDTHPTTTNEHHLSFSLILFCPPTLSPPPPRRFAGGWHARLYAVRAFNNTKRAKTDWVLIGSPFTLNGNIFTSSNNNHKNNNEKSGSGLQHSKLNKDILQKAMGPQVMKSIGAATVTAVGVANLESAANIADGTRSALRELVGTNSVGGRLQARKEKGGGALFIFFVVVVNTHHIHRNVTIVDVGQVVTCPCLAQGLAVAC